MTGKEQHVLLEGDTIAWPAKHPPYRTQRSVAGYKRGSMSCTECEELKRRQEAAAIEYVKADQRRKAYVPKGAISGSDISELARLDQEVENAMRKMDRLTKEYSRHRRDFHPKGVAS